MKFIHLLNKDANGKINRFGGMTIGYEPVDKEKKQLFVTFARCSDRDVFMKEKSRKICRGRLEKGKFLIVEKTPEQDLYVLLKSKAQAHDFACQEGKESRKRGGLIGRS